MENNIKTFTIYNKIIEDNINNKTYNVLEGMTFKEFIKSKFNIDEWKIYESDKDYIQHQYNGFIALDNVFVESNDTILTDDINNNYVWYVFK